MRYPVLALMIVAAGVSLSSTAIAKLHCRAGTIYYQSKHTCLAKEVAVNRGIYHRRHHISGKADRIIAYQARAIAPALAPGAAIPVPPIPRARNGTASAAAGNESAESNGPIVSPAPETARRSTGPYGALVPMMAIE